MGIKYLANGKCMFRKCFESTRQLVPGFYSTRNLDVDLKSDGRDGSKYRYNIKLVSDDVDTMMGIYKSIIRKSSCNLRLLP